MNKSVINLKQSFRSANNPNKTIKNPNKFLINVK